MSKIKKIVKDYGFIFLCACIISSTFIFSYKVCAVSGDSMSPTLTNGEILFMRTNSEKYERYEIVVFNNDNTQGNYIKRVIGLPGETIYMEDNIIYVNGEAINDVVDIDILNYGSLKEGVTLGNDEYFVLGDNRNNSFDSRNIGPVKTEDIKGRVTYSISTMTNFQEERR